MNKISREKLIKKKNTDSQCNKINFLDAPYFSSAYVLKTKIHQGLNYLQSKAYSEYSLPSIATTTVLSGFAIFLSSLLRRKCPLIHKTVWSAGSQNYGTFPKRAECLSGERSTEYGSTLVIKASILSTNERTKTNILTI